MKQEIKQNEILKIWDAMALPSPGYKMMFNYLNTNLWIFKSSDNNFGFLISGTLGQLKNNYKNIITSWQPVFHNQKDKIKLRNCLVIEAKKNIDSRLFCINISSILEIKDKNYLFNITEIEDALKKIEEITLKESDDLSEAVGAWGEIYLMNELIKNTINDINKLEIIESWEGVESRSKVDFIFKSKKTKIEVKTTTESIKEHRFNGLEQVSEDSNYNGYLASFCINIDDSGESCKDLIDSIKQNIPCNYLINLESKLKIRGRICGNTHFRFVINPTKGWDFFKFSQIPRPIIVDGVGSVEWTAVLENKISLDDEKKNKLLKLMN